MEFVQMGSTIAANLTQTVYGKSISRGLINAEI